MLIFGIIFGLGRYNCYFCDFDLCSDCVAGILTRSIFVKKSKEAPRFRTGLSNIEDSMFRGERGGDGGGEGENTTRRKVARTFSDMYTHLSSSYTYTHEHLFKDIKF